MTDETARILDEIGTPTQRAEYAIFQAQHRYREATRPLLGTGCRHCWGRIRAALRRELVDALITYDTERGAESDTYTISTARERIRPLTEFEQRLQRILTPGLDRTTAEHEHTAA